MMMMPLNKLHTGRDTDIHFTSSLLRQRPSEQKSIKNFGEKGTGAYKGTAQILTVAYPLLGLSQEIPVRYSQGPL